MLEIIKKNLYNLRIRRKYTTQEMGASYEYWRDHILPKHVEENYEILSYPDIVDILEIDTKDGTKKYIETTDRYIAIERYVNQSDVYSLRDTTAKFDEYYRMTSKPKEAIILDYINIANQVFNNEPGIQKKTLKPIVKPTITVKKTSKIFISHSSKDKKYVEEIINLIETIGIKSNQIFCSSFEGYGISLGDNFLDTLKKELNDEILVIFVLSNNFYKSPISLCEMGATWIKTNIHIPVLIPPFNFNKMKGVIQNTQGLKLNEPLQLNLLKEKLEEAFNLQSLNPTIWENKRNKVLERINKQIEFEKPKTKNVSISKLNS